MQTLTPDSFCPLTDPQPYQREEISHGKGAVANTLNLFRQGAVGFIVWLGRKTLNDRRYRRRKRGETVRPRRLALLQAGFS